MKKWTIKTAYSVEAYFCDNIDEFLSYGCFCDGYEVIAEEEPTEEEKERFEKVKNAFSEKIETLLLYFNPYILGRDTFENCEIDYKNN